MIIERDVIVVGAGISGSICAAYLAQAGADVLLLDKEIFPRDKCCGDILGEEAVMHISNLGAFGQVDEIGTLIRRIHLMSPNGSECVIPFEGYAVPRFQVDRILVNAAVVKGAEFRDGCKVTGLIKENDYVRGVHVRERGIEFDIRGRIVVLADGSESLIDNGQEETKENVSFGSCGRFIGERAYFVDVNLEEALAKNQYNCYGIFGFHSKLANGYYWIVPSGKDGYSKGYCNVGYIADRSLCEITGEELFDELAKRNRRVASLLENATRVSPWKKSSLKSIDTEGKRAGNGYMVIGDAAGLVMPFIKDGISPAANSGEAAAITIKNAIDTGDFSGEFLREEYQKRIEADKDKLRVERMAAETSYDWTVIDKVIARMVNNPTYTKDIIQEFTS